jgi:hypothetical protein
MIDAHLLTDPDEINTVPGAAFDSALDSDFAATGLPQDRAARIAARRAFVQMKLLFMRAVEHLSDRKGQWLRHQVRLANDPTDLWLLRGPVLMALRQDDLGTRHLRAEFYRGLDTIFPEAFGLQEGITLPPLPEPWAIWSAASGPAQRVG